MNVERITKELAAAVDTLEASRGRFADVKLLRAVKLLQDVTGISGSVGDAIDVLASAAGDAAARLEQSPENIAPVKLEARKLADKARNLVGLADDLDLEPSDVAEINALLARYNEVKGRIRKDGGEVE